MSQGGYLLIVRNNDLQNVFSERIEREQEFTDTIHTFDWKGSDVVIGLVSLDGAAITTACLVRRGRRVATRKHVVTFYELASFDSPLSFADISQNMDRRTRRFFDSLAQVNSSGGW